MINMKSSNLSSGIRCAKFVLLLISFMFAITAVLLVMIGSTINAMFGDFKLFVYAQYSSPPTLLVVVGFLLLAVAFLGAYGAIKESVLIINIYGILLFVVFILEFSAAIAAFIMQTQVRAMLVTTLNDSLRQYETNEYVHVGVDYMQTGLQCCGIDSPQDWRPNWSPNENSTSDSVLVPPSCCDEWSQYVPGLCEVPNDYGCLRRLDYLISQSTMLVASGALTVAFVQLLGVLAAFMLAKTLRRNKSIREARRWQLQQSLGVLISGGKEFSATNSYETGYTQLKGQEYNIENNSPMCSANSHSVI